MFQLQVYIHLYNNKCIYTYTNKRNCTQVKKTFQTEQPRMHSRIGERIVPIGCGRAPCILGFKRHTNR